MDKQTDTMGLKFKHSFLILLLIVSINIFCSVIFWLLDVNDFYSTFINYIFSFGFSLFVSIKIYEKYAEKYSFDVNTNYFKLVPFVFLLPILLQFGLISHIVHLIPMPDLIKQMFYELGNDTSWPTLLTIVVLAPVLEELICRGIILKGLLKNYSPIIAIGISSLIFGIMHLNPWQFIGAFVIGIVNGWLFWKTKNIVLPIIVHFANNLFFTFFGIYYGSAYLVEKPIREVFDGTNNQILSVIICLGLSILILYYIGRTFRRTKG